MEKIILDTDIGGDIDDAVCLAYLLSQPKCELLGITTVGTGTLERAMIADAMCKVAGKEIPIYPGIDEPLFIDSLQPPPGQAEKLCNWPHKTDFEKGKAIEFLNQTIRKHPNEIILLAIGPLTNIALLFKLYPDIPSLLKGVVLMSGAFFKDAKDFRPLGEWNVRCDPHASGIVFKTNPAYIRAIGLDVTTNINIGIEEARLKFNKGILRIVADFAEVWFNEKPGIWFHDPITAATIFNDHICNYEKGNVSVIHEIEKTGITDFENDPNGCCEAAASINKEEFLKEFFTITTGSWKE